MRSHARRKPHQDTGRRLRASRDRLRLTVETAAEQAGVKPATWLRWEAGESRMPAKAAQRWCAANAIECPPWLGGQDS